MKNSIWIWIIVILVIAGGAYAYYAHDDSTMVVNPTPSPSTNTNTEDAVVGCYVATLAKDVYTLKIESQGSGNFAGKLSFKNFEKDSSSGTYGGTYTNGILFGDYVFASEGMTSNMQVIFKKDGNTFFRGFGSVDAKTGTKFTDLSKITYDPKQAFIKTANCPI